MQAGDRRGGLIWVLVAIAASGHADYDVGAVLEHNLTEYAGLLLFLLSAMTYVNVLDERNVFAALRSWMVARGFSLRTIFWLTGLLAFFLSPVLDNLTTALVMGAVALAVGRGEPRFLVPACINIVVAANAGGAFSPFGDITTLMVWQRGVVTFAEFFALFLPSLVNWLVPALCMHFAVPHGAPRAEGGRVFVKAGGFVVIGLFAVTIAQTVLLHQLLHLPSFLGMMSGLGLLDAVRLCHPAPRTARRASAPGRGRCRRATSRRSGRSMCSSAPSASNGTRCCSSTAWCCAWAGWALSAYLTLLSEHSYVGLGPSVTNIAVGLASAIIDNIPIMFAVLSMDPEMSHGQWLLVTLTAGVGGSLLSIGSAAGVALMGQARGVYTFMAHLKWIWAIALGYAASVWLHFLLNASLFHG